MEDAFKNWLEFANGYLVLLMSYFSLLFSDYVPDLTMRYYFGFIYIGVIGLFLVFNVVFQTVVAAREYYLKRKRTKQIRAKVVEEKLTLYR